MKIKKKELNKMLQDRFIDGVKAGIEMALKHPETAVVLYKMDKERFRETMQKFRNTAEAILESIKNAFRGRDE